jgi:TPR repeat protein
MEPSLRSSPARLPPKRSGYNDWATAKVAYDRGDYTTALKLYRQMASEGDVRAQDTLGLMYENARGVRQDYVTRCSGTARPPSRATPPRSSTWATFSTTAAARARLREAAKWYRLAAEQGNAQAQNNLAAMCEAGRGVKQDPRKRSAGIGSQPRPAMRSRNTTSGAAYENGLGVPQNYVEAMRWYRKAAYQNTPRRSSMSAPCTTAIAGFAGLRRGREVVSQGRGPGQRVRAEQPRRDVRERARRDEGITARR